MISLPWPPSVNRYWRSAMGRVLISAEGRKYRAHVARWCLLGGVQKADKRLRVSIVAHAPDKRRRDLDNLLKAPLDALTYAGVWEDDSQISDLRIMWGEPSKPGRLEITITEMGKK